MAYLSTFNGLLWFVAALTALVLLQRVLHREIQTVFLILTRRPGITQAVFAFIFFPGVLLHELSHFLMAKILGVQTGRFSLLPQAQANGRLRLGSVETASGGFLRDALIGAAPLLTGCLFVAYAAIEQMHLMPLWEFLRIFRWGDLWINLVALQNLPDFWLWFYLTFAVSSTMLPSASDRHAWLPLGLLVVGLVAVAILAGAGTWMLANLAPPFNRSLGALAMIFGFSALIHALLILPFVLLHRLLTRLTGMDV